MNELKALKSLIDRERTAIRSGDYSRLERLLCEKESLIQSIQSADPPLSGKQLSNLADEARRNDLLLNATARGLQAAADRLRNARSQREQTTYSSDGRQFSIGSNQTKLEQKI